MLGRKTTRGAALRYLSRTTTRRVAWRRSDEIEVDEHCTLTMRDNGLSLVGTVLGAEGGLPVRDRIPRPRRSGRGDHCRPRPRPARLRDADDHPRALRQGQLDRRRLGGARELKGLHRTSISAAARPRTPCRSGASAWRRGRRKRSRPRGSGSQSSKVVKAAQTYTRLDEFTYRYSSGTFEAELIVDDDGLVDGLRGVATNRLCDRS